MFQPSPAPPPLSRSLSLSSTSSSSSSSSSSLLVYSGQINYGEVKVMNELAEVDRAFWLVLDMAFSQYHEPADIGVYYECECEDSFTFQRLKNASEQFVLYLCNRALKPGTKMLVKYVNAETAGSVGTSGQRGYEQMKPMMAALRQEFDLMIKFNRLGLRNSGILDVYCLVCRVPNVFYMFVEKPDMTLADYIRSHTSERRHCRSNNSLNLSARATQSNNSSQPLNHHHHHHHHHHHNHHHRYRQIIWPAPRSNRTEASMTTVVSNPIYVDRLASLREVKMILGSLACTLLQLHESGVVHGSLNPNSIYLFMSTDESNRDETSDEEENDDHNDDNELRRRRSSSSSSQHRRSKTRMIGKVKLANFIFATYLNRAPSIDENHWSNQQQLSQPPPPSQQEQQPERRQSAPKIDPHQAIFEEFIRSKEVAALHSIAKKLSQMTEYRSESEREAFLDSIAILHVEQRAICEMAQALSRAQSAPLSAASGSPTTLSAQLSAHDYEPPAFGKAADKLELFAEAMWIEE